MSTSPLRSLAGLATSVALVSIGLALSTTTAQAVQASAQCPAVFPVSSLTAGQTVTGLTTTSGTEPEAFSGEYVSTLTDGIAAGKDLLVFKLRGSRITHADGSVDAGIWAGMSGSPVYASDGQLIGAVAYGFSVESSDYAGVTPAQYLYDLRTFPNSTATTASKSPDSKSPDSKSPESVKLSPAVKSAVVRDGVSAQAASDGLRQLRPTRVVTGPGLNSAVASLYAKKSGFRFSGFRAGSGSGTTAAAPVYPLTAGGNFAATVSYGDVTLASIGTTTAVCGSDNNDVLAFGHPDQFTGTSTETIHGASAAFIQRDNTTGSYKLANVGAPSGSLLQDRLQGIFGKLGSTPRTAKIESDTTAYGTTRHGETLVSVPDALPFVTALQISSDTITGLNQNAGGDALVTWAIDFTRKDGRSGTYTNTQRYSAPAEIANQVPNDVASDIDAIANNGFEKVSITNVRITSSLDPTYKAYKVGKVEVGTNGVWHRVGNGAAIATRPGATLRLRLTFTGSDPKFEVPSTTRVLTWKISRGARNAGAIKFTGNAFSFDELSEFKEEFSGLVDEFAPQSLDEVLGALRSAARQDDLSTRLSVNTMWGDTKRTYGKVRAPGIVSGTYAVRLVLR